MSNNGNNMPTQSDQPKYDFAWYCWEIFGKWRGRVPYGIGIYMTPRRLAFGLACGTVIGNEGVEHD